MDAAVVCRCTRPSCRQPADGGIYRTPSHAVLHSLCFLAIAADSTRPPSPQQHCSHMLQTLHAIMLRGAAGGGGEGARQPIRVR